MSELVIYSANAEPQARTCDPQQIAGQLRVIGVSFEQWRPAAPVKSGDSEEVILAAYHKDVERIMRDNGFVAVDVISIDSSHPDKDALRQKFLSEHIHSEYEVRFFVDGCGLFYLHVGDKVYGVLCEKGDYISVPANTTHWFDLGPQPDLAAIRFFNNPEGWVAQYSGNPIADRFPRLDG